MLRHKSIGLFTTILFLAIIVSWLGQAAPPSTPPVEGLRNNTPQFYALTGARIIPRPGQVIPSGTLVVRDSKIVRVAAGKNIPAGARVIDLQGKTIYAGLIDAFSEVTLPATANNSGALHWNSTIRPQRSVAGHYQQNQARNEKLRKQGITVRLVAPAKGILKGSSALIATGTETDTEAVVQPNVAQHLQLTVPRGRGRDQYPNSPMGAVALARQSFYDAQWYASAWAAYGENAKLVRPERNDALAALQPYFNQSGLVITDASNELFVLRADRFAREFKLRTLVRGSGNEYRRLDAIKKTGLPIIVPVNFPKPPNVGTAETARSVTLEQLMHWDHAPENPARLDQAGVTILLTSHGLDDAGTFLEAVRKAVQRGLSADSALRALTTTPAALFKATELVGTLETGKLANFVITDGDLFASKTKVLETWVNGKRFEFSPPPLIDARGTWTLSYNRVNKQTDWKLIVAGQPGKLTGTLTVTPAETDKPIEIKCSRISLRDARLSAVFPGKSLGQEGFIRWTLVLTGKESTSLQGLGQITWADESHSVLNARQQSSETGKSKNKPDKDPKKETAQALAASFPVQFPLGSAGRSAPPQQDRYVLFRNATIWTCSSKGILKNSSVLVGKGKILQVGKDFALPAGTLVIDAKGKHISPGIIDCHSHMATDGGVNESAQAITAEVRIGDFIDADDINIYRQLAGGVTSSNILHGSANPIGGQNQVIKLRWGMLGEEMKFKTAPLGIKFALGENVKQSNWGDEFNTRYPQTRMGVEQIMRDAFEAARQYETDWKRWNANQAGIPPRKDLELDALLEILNHKRWIHCHSYRQDEILALIRTLDDFKVRIGTFQHILEGYKVADAMAKHGAMGSAFSDWWAYKFEVYDAIPYNGAIMHQAGVVVSFNSDDRELARHLNHEAAKATKYGGVPPQEALKFVTLNPARQLRIDQYVGSIEPKKDADLVVWSGSPLSILSRCEQTWIDGRKYFDRAADQQQRLKAQQMRAVLIQKILNSGETMLAPGEAKTPESELWPRDDIFCDHGHHQH
ncbi:MAG TPA: amidohydrolase [Planctomycetes bacterium]|nr:amidohydrolase [Planctomycetota bacterium]